MNKEQFITLLRSPATINLNLVKELEEITQQFPYFQNAHLLLAKQYQGHENIRYESYLRKAAAYAPDRRVLYQLIKLEPSEVIHMQKDLSVQLEKEQEPTVRINSDELKDIINVETPVQQPEVSVKEVIHQPEIKREELKESNIPEIKTTSETAVIIKKTKETEVPEGDTTTETPLTIKKTKETVVENNETKESKIPEIKTESQAPVIAPKITEHKIQETDTPTEIPVTTKKVKETSAEGIESKESKIPEIKTGTDAPVISKKTKEIEVPEADIPTGIPLTPEKANETIAEVNELKVPKTDVPSDVPVKSGKTKAESDPQEILAKRLQEIAAPKVETRPVPPTPVEKNTTVPLTPPIPVHQEPREKTEKSTAPQVSKPIIPKEISFEHHSFLEWLKIKDIPVLPTDRRLDYFKDNLKPGMDQGSDISDPENQIIDNFIKTEPRIVPSKSEFYSPGNMARQSAMEHEDLISETLARIYAQQGNIPKAIDAYRRLSLKLPEKSSYFAALIKELEEKGIE